MSWLDRFSLDLKLGGRMLVKYPGLTIIGGLAMAFAICVGTVVFAVLTTLMNPTLPLPGGERIVQIRNWDVAANSAEPRALHDFLDWRGTLRSMTELGAWRDVTRNLIVDRDARPVEVAEITASGFRIAQGSPLLGRVLSEADERTGAPLVAVLGYEVWRTRFGSDPDVLGRTVQLGADHATVVGVMREGFAFPVSHELWTPLRTDALDQAPRSGPSITVFGLLAPGVTIEMAQAELTTVGRRAAAERPGTHEHLQAQVTPYANLFFSASSTEEVGILFSVYFFAGALLVLICGNVALLLFARAATRENELVVRTALGASRGRIVAQLFVEALVLGGVAAVVGLVAADIVLRTWGMGFLEVNLGRLPFWFDLRLTPDTVLFAFGLTVFGSAIAGVLPALKVTRGMGSRLKQATAGAGGLQFGGLWTAVIVVQVAITVAFPAVVYVEQWQLRRIQTFDAGFAAEEYLAVRVARDAPAEAGAATNADEAAARAAFASSLEELRRRVAAEPGVAGVTFADRLPRTARPEADIELADGSAVSPTIHEATVAAIDPSYFGVLEAPVLAGRGFRTADLAPGATVAIVDQGFVDQVLAGRNPIGQQIRFVGDPSGNANPWIEIVGVVRDLGMSAPTRKGRAAGLYIPVSLERLDRVYMMVHAHGEPMTLGPQVREIAAAVDPSLRLSELQPVDEVTNNVAWFLGLWLRVTVMMTGVALLLSLSGIYAVLSFIVSRRTREIGVRVALGASRARVIAAIFRRPLIQVALGVVAGGLLIAAGGSIETDMPGLTGQLSPGRVAILSGYAVVMLGVCLLACVVPTRRALAVEPTVALRAE